MSTDDQIMTNPGHGSDPASDLALVRAMMEAGRKRLCIDGIHMIIWGGVLGLAFGAQYLMILKLLPPVSLYTWLSAFGIGWVLSFRASHKGCESAHENLAVTAYGSTWFAIGVSATLFFLTSLFFGSNGGMAMTIMTSAMFGSAFFVISRITELRALLIPAIGWWLIMAWAVQVDAPGAGTVAMLAAAAFGLIMVPGLYLRSLVRGQEGE